MDPLDVIQKQVEAMRLQAMSLMEQSNTLLILLKGMSGVPELPDVEDNGPATFNKDKTNG